MVQSCFTKVNNRLFRYLVAGLLWAALTPAAGFAASIDLPKDSNGWTVFTPSSDTRIIYLSEDGNDDSGEVYSSQDAAIGSDPFNPSGPVLAFATYIEAFNRTRDGYPDWILLKRGDEFTFAIGSRLRSGRDADEPFLIGAYGASGPCPLINNGSDSALRVPHVSYLAVFGLDFYAYTRDPDGPYYAGASAIYGISLVTGTDDSIKGVLLEGCQFRFFQNNSIQRYQGGTPTGIVIRRCVISDNYSETSHSQGLYTHRLDGITLEENLFIHNGWYMQSINGDNDQDDGQATMFNHNTYFSSSTNVTFRRNMFIEGASSGNKFTAEEDVENIVIYNNLYIGGEVGISMGHNYPSNDQRFNNITIANNVMAHIGMSRPTNRSLSWYFWLEGWNGGDVYDNYLLHQQVAQNTNTVGFLVEDDQRDVTISDNILYGLLDGIGLYINSDDISGMVFSDNTIQFPTDADYLISAGDSTSGSWQFSDNCYFGDKAEDARFRLEGTAQSLAQWQSATGDTSTFAEFSFPDASRDIAAYQAHLGDTATIEAFISACRSQTRYTWDPRYATDAVNDWIKAGFTEDYQADGDDDAGDNDDIGGGTSDDGENNNGSGGSCFISSAIRGRN